MPLQATSGAASYDAFGGGKAVVPNYIEDVFSTYLYTGNGSTQTINNGIDLAGKGGLVWLKGRSQAWDHGLFDTARGAGYRLVSNSTAAENFSLNYISSFNSNGFSLGAPSSSTNTNGDNYASWTFRKQPKFFDVVTYTGNGTTQNIAHNLGSTPGFIMVKHLGATTNWPTWHRGLTSGNYVLINTTDGQSTTSATGFFGNNTITVDPTSTSFTVGANGGINQNGGTFVAYLFAHDAGGFGLTGTDNVISCGSYTGSGSASNPITVGFEPQWILLKNASAAADWVTFDNMRGVATQQFNGAQELVPNASSQESTSSRMQFNATGFNPINNQVVQNAAGNTYIYIAIRRGPMKTPTTGTSVFSPNVATSGTVTTNFAVDAQIFYNKGSNDTIVNGTVVDRLRGVASTATQQGNYLQTSSTNAELNTFPQMSKSWSNTGFSIPDNTGGTSSIYWNFRRAPGFFDEVCYTGVGFPTALTNTHNLGVAPEMMIVKKRSATQSWFVYHAAMGNNQEMYLNQAASQQLTNFDWNSTTPSATTFTVNSSTNDSGATYVAYLFATCPGVSRVGSYTGTGTSQVINCGFTAGSRFVLIKRTDAAGDWYVWDTARGIVAGNDPYLLLNSTAAEMTLTDYVDPVSTGFELSSTALATVNVSGGTYIFLAIA